MRNWDEEYEGDMWNSLGRIDEVGHHGIVAALITYLGKGNKVLDLGCGVGTLETYLAIREYHGLDISTSAIRGATPRQPYRLFVSDMEKWTPPADTKYSCIIFNESYYYLNNPTEMLEKVKKWLEPDGVLIISMWQHDTLDLANWKKLKEFEIKTDTDSWRVGAYKCSI